MAGKKPAAAKPLKKAAEPGYWDSVLALRNPSDPLNQKTDEPENAPHGSRPSPDSPPPAKGGGGGGGAGGTPPPEIDWTTALGFYIDDPGLVKQIADWAKAHPTGDPKLLLAIVRGSEWWKRTFPGFNEGFRTGLFSDEGGYRAWYTAANNAFKRYYGRDMTAAETVNFLGKGYNPGTIEAVGGGHAYVEANKGDIQYYEGAFDNGPLSPEELQAYGEQKAGLSSTTGSALDTRIQNAIARAQRVFQGVLASPNFQLNSQGLLQTQGTKTPDIGA